MSLTVPASDALAVGAGAVNDACHNFALSRHEITDGNRDFEDQHAFVVLLFMAENSFLGAP